MTRRAERDVPRAIEGALERVGVRPGSSLIVGLSGGADSVALTSALLDLRERLGLKVAAAHLNHRIRPEESDRDEEFVRAMCAGLGIDLIVERAEGLDASANLEERAREARHEFLRRSADTVGADFIVLGHHRDDQAETVLMRLMRGAGASGLAAMAERGPGRIVRPMLSVTRGEIRAYLDARALPFVEDSSNSSPDFVRNKIRHQLLPMLERDYAPGLSARLVELAAEMRSLDDLVDTIASREMDSMRAGTDALDVSRFVGLNRAVQAATIRLFVEERTGSLRKFSRTHVEDIRRLALEGGPSDLLNLPGRWRAAREYNLLRLIPAGTAKANSEYRVPIAADGITMVEAAGLKFEACTVAASDASMPRTLWAAVFDSAKIEGGLVARNFKAGDRIHPIGMRGTRKVQDVLVDRKVARSRRDRLSMVIIEERIAWIPGCTRGNVALVTKATETVLRVEASEG